MAKKLKLSQLARARIDENTYLKIKAYADRHKCDDSDVIRAALKKFLRFVSTKKFNEKRGVNKSAIGA